MASRRWGVTAAVLAAAMLSGCGMSSIMPSGGLFGGQSTASTGTTAISDETMLAAAKVDGGAMDVAGAAQACPQIVVWPNDQFLTVFEPGRDGDGLAVMHRGEITKTARECRIEPGQITVKYGFSGRVLLGPRGTPGEIAMPVYVHVTDAGRQRLRTDPLQVFVQVSPDKPIGYFSTVQTVTFAIPEGTRPGDFKLFVGFQKADGIPAGTQG